MEMDKLRKSTTAEVARLEAALKKSDLKIHGLERNLEQKVSTTSTQASCRVNYFQLACFLRKGIFVALYLA